jgi:DNA-binding transcriptional ArsR family regulator
MPVSLSDKQQRVLTYMKGRKSFVPVNLVAKHFLISQSNASTVLRLLFEAGMLDRVKSGNELLYKVKQ